MSQGGHVHASTAVLPITQEERPEATERNVDVLHTQDLKQDISQPATEKEMDHKDVVDRRHVHSDTGGDASTDVLGAPGKLHQVKENIPEVIRNVEAVADVPAAPSLDGPKQSNGVNGAHALAQVAVQQDIVSEGSDVPAIVEGAKLATISGADTASAPQAQSIISEGVTRVTPEEHIHTSTDVGPLSISHLSVPSSVTQPFLPTETTAPAATDVTQNEARTAPEGLSDIKLATPPSGASDTIAHDQVEVLDAPAVVPGSSDKPHAAVPTEIAERVVPLHTEETKITLPVEGITALPAVQDSNLLGALEQSQVSAQIVHTDVTKEMVPVLEAAKDSEVVKMDGGAVAPQENAVGLDVKEVPAPNTIPDTAAVIPSSVGHNVHLVKDVIPASEPEIQSTIAETPALAERVHLGSGPDPPQHDSHPVETTAPAVERTVQPEIASTMQSQAEVLPPAVETLVRARSATPVVEAVGPETSLVAEVPATAVESVAVGPGMLGQISESVNVAETPIVEEVTAVVETPVVTAAGEVAENTAVETNVVQSGMLDQISEPPADAAEALIVKEVTAAVDASATESQQVVEQVATTTAETAETTIPVETIAELVTASVEAPAATEIRQAAEEVAEVSTTAVETTVVMRDLSEPSANAGATIPETPVAEPVTAVVEAPAPTQIQQAAEEVAKVPATVVETAVVMPDQIIEPLVNAVETTILEAPIVEQVTTVVVEAPVTTETQQAVAETVLAPEEVLVVSTAEVEVHHATPATEKDTATSEDVSLVQVILPHVADDANTLVAAQSSEVEARLETKSKEGTHPRIAAAPEITTTTPEKETVPPVIEALLVDTNLDDVGTLPSHLTPQNTPLLVKDVHDPATHTEIEAPIASSLPPAEADAERPKSPWTPSYSVTTQGPDIQDQDEITELEQLSPPTNDEAVAETTKAVEGDSHVTEVSSVVAEHHEAVEDLLAHIEPEIPEGIPFSASLTPPGTEDERPKSPWTPSYSVMVQGSVEDVLPAENGVVELEQVPILEEAATQKVDVVLPNSGEMQAQNSDGTESASAIQIDTSAAHSEESELVPQTDLLETTVADLERPKSPWTPSYSVTSQGSVATEPLAEETTIEVEELSPSATAELEVAVNNHDTGFESSQISELSPPEEDDKAVMEDVDVIPTSGAVHAEDSDEMSIVNQVSAAHSEDNAKESEVVPQADLLAATEVEVERPKSPWTPSYSVMRQGSVASDQLPEEHIADVEQPAAREEPRIVDHDDAESQPAQIGTTDQPVDDETANLEPLSPAEGADTIQRVDVVVPTVGAEQPQVNSDDHDTSNAIQSETLAVSSEGTAIEAEQAPQADLLATTEVELERPKSPWTPSYSVMRQGSVASDQLPEEHIAEPAAREEPRIVDHDDSESQPAQMGTTDQPVCDEPAKLEQPSLAGGFDTAVTTQEVDVVQSEGTAAEAEVVPRTDLLAASEVELERPKSPWTPSYSVMSQGSVPADALLEQTTADMERLSLPVTAGSQVIDGNHDARFQPAQTSTAELSVQDGIAQLEQRLPAASEAEEIDDRLQVGITTQKSDIMVPTPEAAQSQDSDEIKIGNQIDTIDSAVHSEDDTKEPELALQTGTDLLATTEIGLERPKSPWTPSYSVMQQGSVAAELVLEEEISDLGPLSCPTTDATQAVDHRHDAESQPTQTDEFDSGVRQGDVPEKIDLLVPLEVKAERPKSPWTPSYSVMRQGSVTADVPTEDNIAEINLPPQIELPSREASAIAEKGPHENVAKAESASEHSGDTDRVEENGKDANLHTSYGILGQGAAATGPVIALLEQSAPPLTNDHEALDGSLPTKVDVQDEGASTTGTDLHKDKAELIPEPRSNILAAHEEAKEVPTEPLTPLDTDAERHKSPWTPSYSVMTQGPDVGDKAADVEQFPATSEPHVVDINQPVIHFPQDDSLLLNKESLTAELDSPNTPDSIKPVHHNEAPVINDSDILSAIGDSSLQLIVDTSLDAPAEETRPKSPWTPSYSVTTMGNTLPDSPELDELEQLPQAIQSDAQLENIGAEHPTGESGTSVTSSVQVDEATGPIVSKEIATEPSAVREPSSLGLIGVQVTDHDESPLAQKVTPIEETNITLEDDAHASTSMKEASPLSTPQREGPDRPTSPWIASHSVTRQGSGFLGADASGEELNRPEQLSNRPLDPVEAPHSLDKGTGSEVFPSNDNEPAKPAKPTVSRLAPVNEDARSEDASTLLNTSPTTTRTRHESTTSSRFFPGGWFAPKPEGRTSLDTARGEIVSPVNPSPVVPTAPPPSAVDREVQEENEKKSRWCIVM